MGFYGFLWILVNLNFLTFKVKMWTYCGQNITPLLIEIIIEKMKMIIFIIFQILMVNCCRWQFLIPILGRYRF